MTVYYVTVPELNFEKCYSSEEINKKLLSVTNTIVNWYNEESEYEYANVQEFTEEDVKTLLETGEAEFKTVHGLFVENIICKKLQVW